MNEAKNQAYTFFGRVLPERVPLSIEISEVKFPTLDFILVFKMETSIHDSQVVCNVTVEEGKSDLDTLQNIVENII